MLSSTPLLFTAPDTWTGGDLELLLALGDATPDQQRHALRRTWSWKAIDGPFPQQDIEPNDQRVIQADAILDTPRLYGVATLPNATQAAFSTYLLSYEATSWLYAGLPLGSLGRAYDVGAYPFTGSALDPWVQEIHTWLRAMAEFVFEEVQFDAGLIGWLTAADVDVETQGPVPEERFHTYLRRTSRRLCYYSPTEAHPLVTAGP